MPMNRKELVAAVAAQSGLQPEQADAALRSLSEVITAVVAGGDQVTIPGFIKFDSVARPEREGRNPSTGEPMHIAASTAVRATPLTAFKTAVKDPSQAPKLASGVRVGAANGS